MDIHGYISYSDPETVARLIKERSQIDSGYDGDLSQPFLLESGTERVVEDILCTYIDLDRQIDIAGLSPNERRTVNSLMQGYGIDDIAKQYHVTHQSISVEFRRAVRKICDANNRDWMAVYGEARAASRPDLLV